MRCNHSVHDLRINPFQTNTAIMSKKKQAPEDVPIGTTLDELDHRHIVDTETPKSLLYIGVAALVVAVIVALVFNNHIENKKAAAEAMGSASSTEELQAVADEHAGTVSAGTALIELSNQQIAEGRFEEGVATIDSFLEDYSDHPLAAKALLAKASALIRLDRTDDAMTTLDQFNATHNDSPLADLATLLRGDIEKQRGNSEAAETAYAIVASSDAAGGSLAQLANSRQEFVNYTSPREVEPAPEPEPELPTNGNLPPAPTANPEMDALINKITKENEATAAEEAAPETIEEEAAEQVAPEPAESAPSEETTTEG